MLILEFEGNSKRMNATSPVVNILVRRQLHTFFVRNFFITE